MKLSTFLTAILSTQIILAIDSQKFCDEAYKYRLFEGIFNFDQIVYAFRPQSLNVWLLEKPDNDSSWKQIGNPIKINDLFSDSELLSMHAGFAVTNFPKCDPFSDNTSCDNINVDFNPNNVTFIFNGNDYRIYRRLDYFRFSPVNISIDSNIPWSQMLSMNENEFLGIKTTIDAVVYDTTDNQVALLGNSIVYRIMVREDYKYEQNKSSIGVLEYSPLPESARFNGGIIVDQQIIVFADNKVWNLQSDSSLINMNQTYWQYFECDEPLLFATQISDSTTIRMSTDQPINITQTTNRSEFIRYRRKIRIILIFIFICIAVLCLLMTVVLCVVFHRYSSSSSSDESETESFRNDSFVADYKSDEIHDN